MNEDVLPPKMLYAGKYEPVSGNLVFIKATPEEAAEVFCKHLESMKHKVVAEKLDLPLEKAFADMFPLTFNGNKWCFIGTDSPWTLLITNGRFAFIDMLYFGKGVGEYEVAMFQYTAPHAFEEDSGSSAVNIEFRIFAHRTAKSGDLRWVELNKNGNWSFSEKGTALPFEDLERYQKHRTRDRVTLRMLERYAEYLGINLFQEDFYRSNVCFVKSLPLTTETD